MEISFLIWLLLLRNAVNVTEREQVIGNQTTNETRPLSVPRFLGISVKFQEDEIPELVLADDLPTTDTENRDTTLIAILVPTFVVLFVCFGIFVVVIVRRTRKHYRFE